MTIDSTVILITGASRGIGLELVKLYASNPNNIVIAGVRDVKNAAIQALIDGSEYQGKIHPVKLDAGDVEGNKAAAKEVEAAFGKLDVLWANAGAAGTQPLISTTTEEFEGFFRTNTLGPLVLFQAFHDLLVKSTKAERKFIVTSTLAGSITANIPFPIGAYGASKAAVNYLAVKIQQEHGDKEKLAVVSIHPGMVMTDMGKEGVRSFGVEPEQGSVGDIIFLTPQQSAESIKAIADAATIESHGGKFFNYDGTGLPW